MPWNYAAKLLGLRHVQTLSPQHDTGDASQALSTLAPGHEQVLQGAAEDSQGLSGLAALSLSPPLGEVEQDLVASHTECVLSFHQSVILTSYLQLSFRLPDDFDPPEYKQTCLRLTGKTYRKLELSEVDKTEYLSFVRDDAKSFAQCTFFVLSIQYDVDHFCAENLHAELPSSALRLLETALNSELGLRVVIKVRDEFESDNLRNDVESFKAAFGSEHNPQIPSLERMLEPDESLPDHLNYMRPEPARAALFDWRDYVATLGLGAAIVGRGKEKEAKQEAFQGRIIVFGTEDETMRRYFAVIEPPEECSANLRAGDKATVTFGLLEDDAESQPWGDMRVIASPPWADKDLVTVYLEPRLGRSPPSSLPVTPFPRDLNGSVIKRLIAQHGQDAIVSPDHRHSEFCYIVKAISDLDSGSAVEGSMLAAVRKFLVGQKPRDIPRYDIYASLAERQLATEHSMNLNDSQKSAIRMSQSAPAGFVFCQGGPGTGKTHFVIQAVKPFFVDSKEHRVLLTAQGNRAADTLAVAADQMMKALVENKQVASYRYVVRLESIKTMKVIALRAANQSRSNRLQAGPQDNNATVQGRSSTEHDAAVEYCRAHSTTKYEDVYDERVKYIELSVGHKMLQIAGIEPNGPVLPEMPSFANFVSLYERFGGHGRALMADEILEFDKELEFLMSYTISNATAVSATVALAADSTFSKFYSEAELIVVDEASRVPEYNWWPLLAFFPNAIGKIMVGDPYQLPPTIDDCTLPDDENEFIIKFNPCKAQLKISLQQRAQRMGMLGAFFTVQYRAMPEIAEIYSTVCYQSRLLSDSSTRLENRPLAREVVHHNLSTYGVAKSVVFFHVKNARQAGEGDARYCLPFGNATLRVLHNLLQAGFGSTIDAKIAILTPYRAQVSKLMIARDNMSKQFPMSPGHEAAKSVSVETADMVQGMEYDIVIIDPVVTHSAGFLTMERLNVLFSRAKYGLYVVGNSLLWDEMRGDNKVWVRKFGHELVKYKNMRPDAQPPWAIIIRD